MLIYNQAFDIYHTMFRLMLLTKYINSVVEIEKLRILDFYLTFPGELRHFKSYKGFAKYKNKILKSNNEYENLIDRKSVV